MKRAIKLNDIEYKTGDVVYWMSIDQRAEDNWALIYAKDLAKEYGVDVRVVFCLVPRFLEATERQYEFMLKGLEEVEKGLNKLNIKFDVLTGEPGKEIVKYLKKERCGCIVTDFDPLKIKQKWKKDALKADVPFYEVDAHNIVPCWIASDKQEFAARTFRPKIKKKLKEFLTEFPKIRKQKQEVNSKNQWEKIRKSLKIDRDVKEISWIKPGEKQAKSQLKLFLKKLSKYDKDRNDPNKDACSNLSPYLHFGQISAQRVALEIKKNKSKGKSAFLEELIVRRELSDNFCYYNTNYDSFEGFPDWAKKTLNKHKKDKRDYLYTKNQFENAKTHDKLWNAAQKQMVQTGKMHGFLRMYWAKKILEWTKNPEQALKIAIYLNDKYELDGRDPNGYVGCAWSIGGVHDRAWGQRKVFGKIRFMSSEGCKRKFDVDKFIKKFS